MYTEARKRHEIKAVHISPCPIFSDFFNIVICQCIARQRLDKHPAIRARNNKTNVYSSLLDNSQRANGVAR
jgi:hypothetical protein